MSRKHGLFDRSQLTVVRHRGNGGSRMPWYRGNHPSRSAGRGGDRSSPPAICPRSHRQPRKNGRVTQDGDSWRVTCSTCGASRDGLDDGIPCPSCGSTAKTVHASSFDEVGAAEDSLGITAVYEKQRPWQEKWQEAEAAYHALTEVYRGSVPGGAEEWKSIALSFFRTCHELPDAIADRQRKCRHSRPTQIQRAAERRSRPQASRRRGQHAQAWRSRP